MKTYKVKASYITYLSAEIQANSLEEAQQIADNMDGSDFGRDGSEDWNVDSVEEVQS